MVGKIISGIIAIVISIYVICLVMSFFMQETVRQNIDEAVYNAVEAASTSGMLSKHLHDKLYDDVGRFGNYKIRLKLEKYLKPGIYDTFYDRNQIIDVPLNIGDRLTLYLEDTNSSIFERLINANILGHAADIPVDTRVRSVKSAIITKKPANIVDLID